VLPLHRAGDHEVRPVQGQLDGRKADRPLPPIEPGRVRSSPLASHPPASLPHASRVSVRADIARAPGLCAGFLDPKRMVPEPCRSGSLGSAPSDDLRWIASLPAQAPSFHLLDHRREVAAPLGERVLDARWDLLVLAPGDDAGLLQRLEPHREHPIAQTRRREDQFREAPRTASQCPDDIGRPFLAEQLEARFRRAAVRGLGFVWYCHASSISKAAIRTGAVGRARR